MKRERISDAVGGIDARHIQEAADYVPEKKKAPFSKILSGRSMIAAILVLCLFVCGSTLFFSDSMAVSAYAYGIDEEIPASGAVIRTGSISDRGEMKGKPLMFYLSGENIAAVRFSCKNQQICFTDWTEKRDEFGLARNFTVPYGEDKEEYYYLVIDWVPNDTIRALTDQADTTVAALPPELREDVIVLEITFANGKSITKALTISLLDDGAFFALFDDYTITEQDSFVARPDSAAIPREILYAADGMEGMG